MVDATLHVDQCYKDCTVTIQKIIKLPTQYEGYGIKAFRLSAEDVIAESKRNNLCQLHIQSYKTTPNCGYISVTIEVRLYELPKFDEYWTVVKDTVLKRWGYLYTWMSCKDVIDRTTRNDD